MTRRSKIALVVLAVAITIMGYYAWRLKRRAERLPARAVDTRPIAPPVAGTTEHITLFVADDSDGMLHRRETAIALPRDPSQRAREVLRALLSVYLDKDSRHPLAPGADVKNVFLVKPNLAVVNANSTFADGHRSGILLEQLTVASIAQTLAANLTGVTRVKILVEGKERETLAGHADLMTLYDLYAGEPWPVAP
jgi:Sporulation and spore germination